MKATQLAVTIDKVIEKNPTIQALKFEQHRQADEQCRLADEQCRLADKQCRLADKQQQLADEQHRQGVILEDIQGQVQTIAEAVTPSLRCNEEMPEIKNTLKSHREEITMTKQTLKRHIKDPNAHDFMGKS